MLDTLFLRPLLHFTTIHPTPLHYTAPNYTSLHFTILHPTTLHYASPNYISLHFTTLHPTTLHSTSLHLSTLHFLSFKLHTNTYLDPVGTGSESHLSLLPTADVPNARKIFNNPYVKLCLINKGKKFP